MLITSRQNPKIALIRNLSRSRKARLEAGIFAVEGEKLFFEAVASGLVPKNLLITENFSRKNALFREKAKNLCKIDIISDNLAEYISDTKTPQGVFFTLPLLDKILKTNTIYNSSVNGGDPEQLKSESEKIYESLLKSAKRLIILDDIQDPGNVGAIIRSCEAFGIDLLLLSESCADINSPKVIRSAMGSAFRLPVYRGASESFVSELKEKGFVIIGASLNERASKICGFKFPEKCAVVIGSEGRGISERIMNVCGGELYIPQKKVESLNAAVAASIIMYVLQGE